MKVGIGDDGLLSAKSMLIKFMRLDPRGGYYKQRNMEAGLDLRLVADGKRADVIDDKDGDLLSKIAYKLRVMLSHARVTYDNSSNHHNHQLRELFAEMQGGSSLNNGPKRRRKDLRIGSRPHPFIHFRKQEESDDENETQEDEAVTCISKWFDVTAAKCKMLLSDGSEQLADKYDKNEEGMLIAIWHSPSTQYVTEVPNVFLRADGTIQKPEPLNATPRAKMPAVPNPKGKAKATCKAKAAAEAKPKGKSVPKPEVKVEPKAVKVKAESKAEPDGDGVEEEDKADVDVEAATPEDAEDVAADEDGEQVIIEFRATPSHKGCCTVQCRMSEDRKDKAQVLSVSPQAEGLTAREMCESVAMHLEEFVQGDESLRPKGDLKSDKVFLEKVRDYAQQFRSSVANVKGAS